VFSGGKGQTWYDLNADGRFDYVLQYANMAASINVEGTWVPVRKGFIAAEGLVKKTVPVADGREFAFDSESGIWKAAPGAKSLPSHE
jgi:hypothetical protein